MWRLPQRIRVFLKQRLRRRRATVRRHICTFGALPAPMPAPRALSLRSGKTTNTHVKPCKTHENACDPMQNPWKTNANGWKTLQKHTKTTKTNENACKYKRQQSVHAQRQISHMSCQFMCRFASQIRKISSSRPLKAVCAVAQTPHTLGESIWSGVVWCDAVW